MDDDTFCVLNQSKPLVFAFSFCFRLATSRHMMVGVGAINDIIGGPAEHAHVQLVGRASDLLWPTYPTRMR